MATFDQPVNRKEQLKGVLDGYAQAIERDNWLSEAFQKDGIQNAWGARLSPKGDGWRAGIYFYQVSPNDKSFVFIEDEGTYGLTGIVPKNYDEEIKILQSDDERQRLGRFLSSDWSLKTEHSIGSRGRGKMVFIGASRVSTMYFESVRHDDQSYVFGKTYLDEDFRMKIQILEGKDAHDERIKCFGRDFPRFKTVGTRIIVPNPEDDLVKPIIDGTLVESIQQTWWEIIAKHNAKILVGKYESPILVGPSPWLPVEGSDIKYKKTYSNLPIEKGDSLKIKKITLAYLKDKEVPFSYNGIAIQRRGMNVQLRPTYAILPELPYGKVYGEVEFENDLGDAMLELESLEHYSFNWSKGVAYKVNKVLKSVISDFAKEYKIIGDDRRKSSEDVRQAENEVQKQLNQIAKSFGLRGVGFGTKRNRGVIDPPPTPSEKIIISIPGFILPSDSGRVNIGQLVEGALASCRSEYAQDLKVHFQVWMYREGGYSVPGLVSEVEDVIGRDAAPLQAGWEQVKIDSRFERGRYYFKAKLIALEDKYLDGKSVQKGDILYREVSRSFWVEEEPPARGFFKDIQPTDSDEKDKYVGWIEEDGYILTYNRNHPKLRLASEDPKYFQDVLLKEGTLVLWSIVLGEIIANPDEIDSKLKKITSGVENGDFESQIKWIMAQRSQTLWS